MKAKEKAKELFDKMLYCYQGHIDQYTAKQCALIAVDEIVKSEKLNYLFTKEQLACMEFTSDDRWIHETFVDYWDEVKDEIEKL